MRCRRVPATIPGIPATVSRKITRFRSGFAFVRGEQMLQCTAHRGNAAENSDKKIGGIRGKEVLGCGENGCCLVNIFMSAM